VAVAFLALRRSAGVHGISVVRVPGQFDEIPPGDVDGAPQRTKPSSGHFHHANQVFLYDQRATRTTSARPG